MKKNLTMEELCDGICCPAYESKLERNQYESLNETIIPKLCERLDISYEDVKCACDENELIDAIHEYFTSDLEKLGERLAKYSDNTNFVNTNLIACLYYLLKKEYDKLNNCVRKLDIVKSSMNIIEMATFLIITIHYNIATLQYEKAINYYRYLKMLECDNQDIEIMQLEAKFIIDCNLYNKFTNSNHDIIEMDYKDLKSNHILSCPITKQINLQLEYLKTLDGDSALEYLANLEKDDIYHNMKNFTYVKALALAKANKFTELVEYLDNLNNIGFKYASLYAYAVRGLILKMDDKNSKAAMELKKKLKGIINDAKMESGDTIHIAFLKLMELEIDGDTDVKIFEYIKFEMGALFKNYNVPFYFEYCLNRSYVLIGKLTKYKEAYELLSKLLFNNN